MSFNTFLQEGQNEDKAKSFLKKAEKDDVYDDLLSITSPYKQDQHGKNNKHLPKLVDFYLNGTSLDHIKYYYDKFIKNTKIAGKPIDKLNFNEFEQLVDSSAEQVKDVKSDDEIKDKPFYEDDKVKIYKGTNKEQCIRYGKGKKYGFCISRSDHSNLFHGYRGRGATFYFVYFKEPQENCPTDLVVIHAYPNDTYQINYAQPNQDHEISKEEIKSKFPDLAGAINQLAYVPHDEKEKHIYAVIRKAQLITDLKTLDDQLLWVEMGGDIKDNEWDDLINQEEIVKKYIETGVGDIPSYVLSKYPKYLSRYNDKLKQRIDMKLPEGAVMTSSELNYLINNKDKFVVPHNFKFFGLTGTQFNDLTKEEIESTISKRADFAHQYALYVIKGRFLEAEPVIAKYSGIAYQYARDIIKGRWPEAEAGIAKSANFAYQYARDMIHGRWLEAEAEISQHSGIAYDYAKDIIKGRFPEAEAKMKKYPEYAYQYARDIIKGRWPEAEPPILRFPRFAYEYARDIIKGRWPEAEELLKLYRNHSYTTDYNQTFGTNIGENIQESYIKMKLKEILFENSNLVLNEWIEPKKPNQVTKKKVTKNQGTMKEKKIDEYKFITSKNNIVKVQFDIEDGKASIIFYVNDVLSDDSSKKSGSDYDTEVLSGVLWVIKYAVEKLNLHTLEFSAWKSDNDFKLIKNVDMSIPTKNLLHSIDEKIREIQHTEPVLVPPSEIRISLAKKLNRDLTDVYDFDKDRMLDKLKSIKKCVEDGKDLRAIDSEMGNEKRFDFSELIDYMKKYTIAYESNTEDGFKDYSNRRESLYSKMIAKYFSDWKVQKTGSHFTLSKV